jgi:beta-galactosidase
MKPSPLKSILRVGFLALLACLALAVTTAGVASMAARPSLDFDTDWRFSLSDSAMAMAPGFDDAGWRQLNVPHDWSSEGPFGAQYGSGNGYAPGGIGWYRKHFTLAPAQKDRLVTVEFDGVYDHAEVWINGQFVGGRPYGYSSFQFDLTRHLKFDGENVLAVRVDHSRYADSRFYTGSGIYRHVRLCLTDPLHIGQWGTFVSTPKVADEAALVRVETTVVNGAAGRREYALQSDVIAADGRVVASRTMAGQLDAGQSQALVQELDVAKPQRWSLETPVLYTLRNRVTVAGAAVDETTTPFGIRTLVFDPDKGFLLNGRSVKLKGVCIHHDAGSLGAAVPDKVLERRLRGLRDLGVNTIRTSHNPPAPELLDLCDRLGLLVKDEAFDEFTPPKKKWVQGWNAGEPGKFGYGESFAEWSVRDMEDLVRRDRNHPSVIMWSIGNEIDYANDPFSHPVLGNTYRPQNPPASDLVKLGTPLIAAVRRFDPTRPVTAALAHVEMSDAVGFGELLDIVGYNYQELRYPADHLKFPKRVIFGSENRHDYQAWAVVRDNDYISGQFLWTGIDYLGEAGRWPSRGSGSGLLDLCGFKKPQAWFRQSLWSGQPMVYISTAIRTETVATPAGAPQGTPVLDRARRSRTEEHWNWPQGSTITVTCYSNCPEIQLTLNGQPVGTRRLGEAVDGVLTWTVPYEPGVLKAVGLKDGKPVCEFALQTAGPASRVELLPDTTQLAADGKDICHVEYRIVDANGVRVPDAAQVVTFEVTGPAGIIGIGNGDLSNSEDPRGRTHQAYQGRGLAILQSKTAPGGITLKATAPNLTPATVTLTSR